MKILAAVTALAFAAIFLLYAGNQDLRDRVAALEKQNERLAAAVQSPAVPIPTRKINALATCLAQLHAQVVGLWDSGNLSPDSRECKNRFYGLGPRIGD